MRSRILAGFGVCSALSSPPRARLLPAARIASATWSRSLPQDRLSPRYGAAADMRGRGSQRRPGNAKTVGSRNGREAAGLPTVMGEFQKVTQVPKKRRTALQKRLLVGRGAREGKTISPA